MIFKLGKKDPIPGAVKMLFGAYFTLSELPPPPAVFGHPEKVRMWGMLGNDRYGDCVWAGAAHETMLLEAEADAEVVTFTNVNVLLDYAACTGFRVGDPSTDQGTSLSEGAAYRRQTGIVDMSGKRHLIDTYVALTPGNLSELAFAVNEFGVAGVGVQLPENAEDQFTMAEVWDVVPGTSTIGGHYIPCVGRNSRGNYIFVTWGRLQAATPEWVRTYMDEGMAYLSRERLRVSGLSPQGFNLAKLEDDFKQLTG